MLRRNNKIKKIVLITFTILIIVFLLYNIVWVFLEYIPYRSYTKGMAKTENDFGQHYYEKTVDGIHYEAHNMIYLGYECCFLTVYENPYVETLDEFGQPSGDADLSIQLFVWPKKLYPFRFEMDEDEYGLDFMSGDIWIQCYVDQEGNVLNEDSELRKEAEQLIEDNKEEVEKLLQGAQKNWDLK